MEKATILAMPQGPTEDSTAHPSNLLLGTVLLHMPAQLWGFSYAILSPNILSF